jgi:hypothetical protein
MTIKTLAAVIGTLAIIVVLFFITKITTPSRLVAKSGFFAGSSTDDWVVEQALLVSGNLSGWRAAKSRCLSKQFGLLVEPKPMIVTFATCTESIRTVPILQHDPDRPEDVMSQRGPLW